MHQVSLLGIARTIYFSFLCHIKKHFGFFCQLSQNDHISTTKNGYISINNRNSHLLATEMYKTSKGLSQPFITKLFKNLRHNSQFTIPSGNSMYHGAENVSFLCPKI